MSEEIRLTELLSNRTLSRIERLRLSTLQNLTSHHRGEHLSGRGGSSIEFSDYRDYSPGDDIRFIDWNIYSRLKRPYMKLFKLEEEMHLVIIVDSSESMTFGGKFLLAKKIATAFGLIGLYGNERVSAWYPTDYNGFSFTDAFPPSHGRSYIKKYLNFTNESKAGGDLSFADSIDNVLKHHKGKGAVLLLSDFLTPSNISHSMNSLFSSGLEIFGVQILSPAEIDPELNSDARFVDSETSANIDISSGGDLLKIYHEHRLNYTHNLEKICKKRSGRFLSVSSETDIETILFDIMQKRGWLKQF